MTSWGSAGGGRDSRCSAEERPEYLRRAAVRWVRGLVFTLAVLFLIGCAGKPPVVPSSSLSAPLLSDVYSLRLSPDRRIVVEMVWPERFGKEIQSVPLDALDLSAARVIRIPGGRWATNFEIDIPIRGERPLNHVQNWAPRYEGAFPEIPDHSLEERTELLFHTPNATAAREVLRILRAWQTGA